MGSGSHSAHSLQCSRVEFNWSTDSLIDMQLPARFCGKADSDDNQQLLLCERQNQHFQLRTEHQTFLENDSIDVMYRHCQDLHREALIPFVDSIYSTILPPDIELA